ncbi:amino acid permease [Shimazuella sp. KC615]|uniref:Amino acid permease n=2 Tax=Shimazuella alba TaxID=2690964 RepID=A0A6I4W3W7_9BACL|nr:amino acid permease [Shimazuella alba]
MEVIMDSNNELKRSMKSRHLFMIALGGVIGTGFFNGSGYTISQAGPIGAVLSYIVGGIVMYLVMLCLGELTIANPSSGSFQDYATRFIGPGTGFMVGWLYWFGWAATVALELLTIGATMKRWFPSVDIWVWSLLFGVILFLVNAFSARSFAETEFWFAIIKVSMIVLFILIGAIAIFGIIPLRGESVGFSYLVKDGIFPNGFVPILMTMIAVNFSFQGTELVGIAAGESENPKKTLPKAINQTVYRTILFFGLAIAVLVCLVPWQQAGVVESPFVAAMDKIGIPYAADIMNFVIITALLSVGNSGLFAATRILYSLSKNGMAPKMLGKVTSRGIPFWALVGSMFVAGLSLLTAKYAADTVYMWILSISGTTAVIAWMAIAASQYFFRRKYLAEGGKVTDLSFRTPLYPFVPIVAFILNAIVMLSQVLDPETALSVYLGIPAIVLMYIIYYVFVDKRRKRNLNFDK